MSSVFQHVFDFYSFLGEYAKQNPQLADGLKLAEIAELRVLVYYIESRTSREGKRGVTGAIYPERITKE